MARGLDSDYIGSLSLMDGFDMRINFDGFEENMKKFMELPIKYLDSAHDKAVRLVEDIHALIYAPCLDNELSNEGQRTLMDPCSNNPIIGYPPTSAEMEKANPDEEVSSSSSLLTVEDSSLCSTATDAPETESVSSKSSDSCASEDSISLERTASTKEETILCNSENLPDSGTPENCNSLVRTVSSEEELILWNPGNSVKPPQPPEQATIVQDYASQETNTESGSTPGHRDTESSACDGVILLGMITEYGEEKSGLGLYTDSHEDSTKHGNTMIFAGETSSHYLSADLFGGADDPNMLADEMTDFVDIDLLDGEERMKDDKAEASLVGVPLAKNSSFKRVFMRSLSNKLRWSKKDMNVHQAVPIRPHEAVNACYEVIPSSDDLQDDWELL